MTKSAPGATPEAAEGEGANGVPGISKLLLLLPPGPDPTESWEAGLTRSPASSFDFESTLSEKGWTTDPADADEDGELAVAVTYFVTTEVVTVSVALFCLGVRTDVEEEEVTVPRVL